MDFCFQHLLFDLSFKAGLQTTTIIIVILNFFATKLSTNILIMRKDWTWNPRYEGEYYFMKV